MPSTSTTGLVFPTNYGVNAINASSGFHPAVDASGSVAAGVKQEAALVMDWSVEEQYVLENGLAKLKDEPKISKYVKIAATLPDKTVRDVALRCRWMTRKRRKREDNNAAKNISTRKVCLPTSTFLVSYLPVNKSMEVGASFTFWVKRDFPTDVTFIHASLS